MCHRYWHHTFKIGLPEFNWLEMQNATLIEYVGKICDPVQTKSAFQEQSKTVSTNIAILPCSKYSRQTQLLFQITQESYQNLHDLSVAIRSLTANSKLGQQRSSRGLLNFIGGLSKSLFGTATEADVEVLKKAVNSVIDVQNNQVTILKTNTETLQSFVKVTNSRMDTLLQVVRNASNDHMAMLEQATHSFTVHIELISDLLTFIIRVQSSLSQLERQYANTLNALENLASGFLPAFLFPENVLKHAFEVISGHLAETDTGMELIYQDPAYYYSSANFVYVVQNQELVLTLKLPLSSIQSPFHFYEIKTYPLIVDQDKDHLMILENMPTAVALDTSKTYYYTLTPQEMQLFETHHASLSARVLLYADNPKSCLMSIFRDQKSLINTACKYTIIPNALESGIHHIHHNTYLFINVPKYSLRCDQGQEIMQQGCQSCILNLQPKCSWSTDNWHVPQILTDNKQRMWAKQYSVNLALLQKFYNASKLDEALLTGQTLLAAPVQAHMPDFKFYRSQLEDSLAADRPLRLDADRVAAQAKDDKLIVATLSHAILSGTPPSDFDFFTTIPGIIMLTGISLTVLMFINMIHINVKIRTITAALLVIEKALPQAEALTLDILNPMDYRTTTPGQIVTNFNGSRYHIFVDLTQNFWPHFISTLLALIFLGIMAYHTYMHFHPSYLDTAYTQILLEIVGAKRTIFIKLVTIRGQEDEIQLEASKGISELEIMGLFFPKLCFRWDCLKISNPITSQRIHLDRAYPLSWYQAFRLTSIIRFPYQCLLAYLNGNRMRRAYIQKMFEPSEDNIGWNSPDPPELTMWQPTERNPGVTMQQLQNRQPTEVPQYLAQALK